MKLVECATAVATHASVLVLVRLADMRVAACVAAFSLAMTAAAVLYEADRWSE